MRFLLAVVAAVFLAGCVEAPEATETEKATAKLEKAQDRSRAQNIEARVIQAEQPTPIPCEPPYYTKNGVPILYYSIRKVGNNDEYVCWPKGVFNDPLTGSVVNPTNPDAIARIEAQRACRRAVPICPPRPTPKTLPTPKPPCDDCWGPPVSSRDSGWSSPVSSQ